MKCRIALLSLLLATAFGSLPTKSQTPSSRPSSQGNAARVEQPSPSSERSGAASLAVRLENSLTTKFVDEASSCAKPAAASRFAASDGRVWLWFDVTGATVGDRARDEWYDPDGNLYRSANWNPLPAGGYRCFWDSINLANTPAAAKPGRWTIVVYYNENFFFSLSFTIGVAGLERQTLSRSLGNGDQCQAPDPVSVFLTTDQQVWLWFSVSNALPGDTSYVEWYEPSGNLYTIQRQGPPGIPWAGDGCFWYPLSLANNPPANKPGAWRARVFYNDAPFFTTAFSIALPTKTGPVVIDGTDANDHGSSANGANQDGWLYMQRVLESLADQAPAGARRTVVSLGAGGDAYDAIQSAFALSSLPRNGWELISIIGGDGIGAWLDQISTANTGILYLTTYNLVPGDLIPEEMDAINTRAAQIAKYVNGVGGRGRGGALFAMAEVNAGANAGAWDWLQSLFPGVVVTTHGTDGVNRSITLTSDGAQALHGITNATMANVRPWHNSFTSVQGRLKTLGTAPDDSGDTRQVILGGLGGDVFATACILSCEATVPSEATSGEPVRFAGSHALSNCSGAPGYEWDFGDGSATSPYPNTEHTYQRAGTFIWKLTVRLQGMSDCVKSGTITIKQGCAAPVILVQPDSPVIASGQPANLRVTLSGGTQPFTYQWYQGLSGDTANPINGATFGNYPTPPLTATTNYWVQIKSGCGKTTNSNTAVVSVLLPGGSPSQVGVGIDFIDPACNTFKGCDGQYIRAISGSRVTIEPPPTLRSFDYVVRNGAVADGVTRILLALISETEVTFSLRKPDQNFSPADLAWGRLTTLDGATQGDGTSLRATPQGASPDKVAYAVYQTPADFPASNISTQVIIQATTAAGIRRRPLYLHRPPIVMVHGVWSGKDAWEGLEKHLKDIGYDEKGLARVDYGCKGDDCKGTRNYGGAGSFDPLATTPEYRYPTERLIETVDNVLYRLRDSGFAATQVDIVAHSMGGLLARSRAARRAQVGPITPYQRATNYQQGDFHKLITVGTPHWGTPLADYLIARRCDRVDLAGNTVRLETAFEWAGYPIGPAIFGFQTSSPEIGSISTTEVKSHAIYATAPDGSGAERFLNLVIGLAIDDPNPINTIFGAARIHDTIVPTQSQRGGFTGNKITRIDGVVHAPLPGASNDINETASLDVWNALASLLRFESVNSDKFDNFLKFTGAGNPPPIPESSCPLLLAGERAIGAAATVALTPARNALFRPGETVPVTLTINGGNKTDGAIFFFGDQAAIVDGSGVISHSFIAPRNRAGKIEITAFTFGPGPENYLGATEIIVRPNAPPTSIAATPANLLLKSVGETSQIAVVGQFGAERIDITSSLSGTSYAVKSGANSIVSVSPGGLITARGFGRDSVVVNNSGQSAVVNVLVSATEQTANLPLANASAASFLSYSFSPESIVSAFGTDLAVAVEVATTTPLPTSLAGTTVSVTDSVGTQRLAPLFFVAPGQINYQLPPGTALGAATITVTNKDGLISLGTARIEAISPGIFSASASGQGPAAAIALRVKADGSQSFEPVARFDQAQNRFITVPIDLGPPTDQVYLLLFGTGLRFNSGLSSAALKIGGVDSQVLYAGPQGGFVGLDQLNVSLPRSLAGRGEMDVTLIVDGKTANTVRVSFR